MAQAAEQIAANFADAWPLLRTMRVKERRSGLPAYTADGRHFLGQAGEAAGFYVVGGDNEAGITHGPGLGKLLAELVVNGQASKDISVYRLDRFAQSASQPEDALTQGQVIRPQAAG
jgi:glycine/D-amino acid oxidase-like deaminating enzyme